jgi:predicted component of type VI protein secretion system
MTIARVARPGAGDRRVHGMKAELVPDNGDPPIPITRDITVVGRREFCDVQVNDASLSKRHCVLVKTEGLIVIRDLGTTNGTKVKGQRVRWAALLPDDRLTLGSYKMRVYLGPDDLPGPSEMARSGASQPGAPKAGRARPKGRMSPPRGREPVRAGGAPQPALLASPTPVDPPAMAVVVGEDDGHWQGLHMLDEDAHDDVIIELE